MDEPPDVAGTRVRAIMRAVAPLAPVPLVPEVALHQGGEPVSVWRQTEREVGETGLPPPYWAFAWAGGQALARYVIDHPGVVRGLCVLDIASGSGLVAIAAARAGAARVTACDVDPLAVAAIAVNAAANDVQVRSLRCDVLDSEGPAGPRADVVLVADAFYERALADRVMRFAGRARARGAVVLAADWGRAYLPRSRFRAVTAYHVPGLGALEDRDTKRTTIWAPAW